MPDVVIKILGAITIGSIGGVFYGTNFAFMYDIDDRHKHSQPTCWKKRIHLTTANLSLLPCLAVIGFNGKYNSDHLR